LGPGNVIERPPCAHHNVGIVNEAFPRGDVFDCNMPFD
jgi:hypothetical protein